MEFRQDRSSSSSSGSGSSFTADLFGAKDSPSYSTTGSFASIFPPPSKVLRKKSSGSEVVTGSWQKQGWNAKQGAAPISRETASYKMAKNPNFLEEKVEPCHLSSSIYYGGQENYSQIHSTPNSGSHPIFKKDGVDDDPNGNNSNGASRGNWWQGSLYY
ncbi:uncharacterized protein LOC126686158 [Mercurialis annua]|uniref:uncharacterized protein LOC126686158 n=1 Tax=Mercurialis annua TaxID=3986 RepID=UPI00215F3AF5|nr:uncharacterized protein LOC126686158 [Mercurialis annua]